MSIRKPNFLTVETEKFLGHAIHCANKQEGKELLEYLDSLGLKWSSQIELSELVEERTGDNLVYRIIEVGLVFQNLENYYNNHDEPPISYQDWRNKYMEDYTVESEELGNFKFKNFDAVVLEDGCMYFLIETDKGFNVVSDSNMGSLASNLRKITRVYRGTYTDNLIRSTLCSAFKGRRYVEDSWKLIWKKRKVFHITMSQLADHFEVDEVIVDED